MLKGRLKYIFHEYLSRNLHHNAKSFPQNDTEGEEREREKKERNVAKARDEKSKREEEQKSHMSKVSRYTGSGDLLRDDVFFIFVSIRSDLFYRATFNFVRVFIKSQLDISRCKRGEFR